MAADRSFLLRRLGVAAICSLLVTALPVHGQAPSTQPRVPTIDELIALGTIGDVTISPDGRWVAYAESFTDWDRDAFVTQLMVADAKGGSAVQLTRGKASVSDLEWSPDSQWITFLRDVDDKTQVQAIRPDGGEPITLTKHDAAIANHEWSADGATLVYSAPEGEDPLKARKEAYGDFTVVRRDYRYDQLWTLAVADAMKAPTKGRQRTRGTDRHVQAFEVSPDGTRVAFGASKTPDLVDSDSADVFVLDLATDQVRPLVTQSGPDSGPRWSPDGRQIAFFSAMGNPRFFHANGRIAVVDAAGGTPVSVTDTLDESPQLIGWTPTGLYIAAQRRTSAHLFRVDVASRTVTQVSAPDHWLFQSSSLSPDGRTVAFAGTTTTALPEVFVSSTTTFAPRALTTRNTKIAGYTLATREVISWKSQDGETIEGVLVKPRDFDPTRKYPLLCVIHGGPTGIDRPHDINTRYYPVDLWAARGALVLRVNYRGSAGYGERFRQLNVRNLGVGDAWDVLSGIDALVARGIADPDRLGCMGWSQGGYISAFLTTSTTRFKAISVGAGISNWATYYYNTDITPFTIQYLEADPAADPEIYRKTSPMSYVMGAKTPTLIQHGEFDRRVPIANAYELRQGLQDRSVPVEMVVYKGFGHGITKPRAMRAVMQHNLLWFNHYIFGDPVPNLVTPPSTPGPAASTQP